MTTQQSLTKGELIVLSNKEIEIPRGFEEICIRKVNSRSLEKMISIRKTALAFGKALIDELSDVFRTHGNVSLLMSDSAIRICLTQDRRSGSRRIWVSRDKSGAVSSAGISSDLITKALISRGFMTGISLNAEILPRLAPSDPVIVHANLRKAGKNLGR
jgi:hypothetical protein